MSDFLNSYNDYYVVREKQRKEYRERLSAFLLRIKPGFLAYCKSSLNQDTFFYGINSHKYKDLKNTFSLVLSFDVEKTSMTFYDKEIETFRYVFSLVNKQEIYKFSFNNSKNLFKQFTFFNMPNKSTLQTKTEQNEINKWLNHYFGSSGTLFRVARNFRARTSDSQNIVKYRGALPQRSSGHGTIWIKESELVVSLGIRCHAMRRILIFDFLVGDQPCWIEFETKLKSKTRKFNEYFSAVDKETPYEREQLLLEQKRYEKATNSMKGFEIENYI